MLRTVQKEWRKEMSINHPCFKKFLRSLNTESSKETYGYKMQKFMKFALEYKWTDTIENFEKLLELDSDKITDLLEDYVDFMEERGDRAVGTDLAAPELFFQNNRKLWHRELVRGGIKRDKGTPGGSDPIEDSELYDVYFGAGDDLRKRTIISLLCSLGIRPGALTDPVLCFKHLIPIEDCYGVKIYDESTDGYWGFLIPEARADLDNYKSQRIAAGENVTLDSPILATLPSRWNAKNPYMTDDNLKEILQVMIRDKVKRTKTGNRYNKALVTMFRKRFNTKLKLNNEVNSNVAELVMAHKLPGAQGNYTKPTMEECFKEVKKAIPELTIDPTKRQEAELKLKQGEINLLEKKSRKIDDLEKIVVDMRDKNSVDPSPEMIEKVVQILKSKKII